MKRDNDTITILVTRVRADWFEATSGSVTAHAATSTTAAMIVAEQVFNVTRPEIDLDAVAPRLFLARRRRPTTFRRRAFEFLLCTIALYALGRFFAWLFFGGAS